MYPVGGIVFDLDGTLIDSRGDIVAAVNHALMKTGKRPLLPAQVVVRFVGDGARSLCARAAQLPEQSEDVDTLLDAFVAYYLDYPVAFTRWMPGAQEALDAFADMRIPLGICTNKPRPVTDAILTALGVRTRFRGVFGGGDLSEKKPAPAPLIFVAKQLGVPVESVVLVGDAPQDVECARRAGTRCIGVENGLVARERLVDSHPDVVLPSLFDLPEVIRRWLTATARVALPR